MPVLVVSRTQWNEILWSVVSMVAVEVVYIDDQ